MPQESRTTAISLDGESLSPETVAHVARESVTVSLTAGAVERIRSGRSVVEHALQADEIVYGLTSALGDRAGERLPVEVLSRFSRDVIRGRAMATGDPLPVDVVRALMVVRLNCIATGGSGASLAVAESILAALNAGLVPEMPGIGSAGASDLCVMAHLGLALIGEGRFVGEQGEAVPAADMLARHGLAPLEPGPKDGLVLCANNAFSAGQAALALQEAGRALETAQTTAAMTMEGFRANLGPLDPRAAAARPQPGQQQAAAGLLHRLAGSGLLRPEGPRRLQDPLSLRCVAPVHGAGYAALEYLRAALHPELNGAGDNPLIVIEDETILHTGNFQMPLVTVALDGLGQSLAHVATACAGRCARLLASRHSGLPSRLSPGEPHGAGMAPLIKPVESLLAEIRHEAVTTSAEFSAAADGVEDTIVNAAQAGGKLRRLIENLGRLLAIEAVMAAQAIDLAGIHDRLPPTVATAYDRIRALVPHMDRDAPMSEHIRAVAERLVRTGRLADPGSPRTSAAAS